MSQSMHIKFISSGFRDILHSDGVRDQVNSIGQDIKSRADSAIGEESSGYSCKTWIGSYGGGRWVTSVTTTDGASIRAEAEHNALSGAV